MKSLILEATEFTPKVEFSPDAHTFELSGVSMPEDAAAFYRQILDWLNAYKENVVNNNTGTYNLIRLNFKLAYCNSASAKFLLSILEKLKAFKDSGHNLEINWYYDAGDDLMLDDGRDLSETINMSFNFLPVIKT